MERPWSRQCAARFRAARRLLLVLAVSCLPAAPRRRRRRAVDAAGAPQAPPDGIAALLRRLEQAAAAGDRAAILALGDPGDQPAELRRLRLDADHARRPRASAMFERDRAPLAGGRAQRLIVEMFAERGIEARLGTWRLDVSPGDAGADPWRIAAVSPAVGRHGPVSPLAESPPNSTTSTT